MFTGRLSVKLMEGYSAKCSIIFWWNNEMITKLSSSNFWCPAEDPIECQEKAQWYRWTSKITNRFSLEKITHLKLYAFSWFHFILGIMPRLQFRNVMYIVYRILPKERHQNWGEIPYLYNVFTMSPLPPPPLYLYRRISPICVMMHTTGTSIRFVW